MKTPCRIDVDRRLVHVGDKTVELAPKEFEILRHLAEANGKVVTRDALATVGWGVNLGDGVQPRSVDQQIARIRRKLGFEVIRTSPNVGYSTQVSTTTIKEVWGSAEEIDRVFGSKPGAWIKVWVPGNVLPGFKRGLKVKVA